MNNSIKLILAAAAAMFAFASCASKEVPAPTQQAPTNDGGVYSDK
ncbi:MAG: hypothetical protein ACI8XO_001963 [Verrucomicrobiales bacterium]|jgi:hypothetical protein